MPTSKTSILVGPLNSKDFLIYIKDWILKPSSRYDNPRKLTTEEIESAYQQLSQSKSTIYNLATYFAFLEAIHGLNPYLTRIKFPLDRIKKLLQEIEAADELIKERLLLSTSKLLILGKREETNMKTIIQTYIKNTEANQDLGGCAKTPEKLNERNRGIQLLVLAIIVFVAAALLFTVGSLCIGIAFIAAATAALAFGAEKLVRARQENLSQSATNFGKKMLQLHTNNRKGSIQAQSEDSYERAILGTSSTSEEPPATSDSTQIGSRARAATV